jgi:hypothetical protein
MLVGFLLLLIMINLGEVRSCYYDNTQLYNFIKVRRGRMGDEGPTFLTSVSRKNMPSNVKTAVASEKRSCKK